MSHLLLLLGVVVVVVPAAVVAAVVIVLNISLFKCEVTVHLVERAKIHMQIPAWR